ncbi:hypothetical protein C8Q76DRAFT_804422 [Earliella scabrosa]|nr:hypothetical protein C8Q76DRAFT_804507 [Earliella scabrosa]KAI0682041.1 hypothetical protein C8Q76DRAFT_804422 [Earliella scabrosa]
MAPGPKVPAAISLIRGFPQMIEDIVNMLNKELDHVRDKLVLPADMSRWSPVLSSRARGCFDTLSTVTIQEVTHRRAMLDELYPGEDELPGRLDAVVLGMFTSSGENHTLWQQFKMSYDSNVLLLETSERESMQKAYSELERLCEEARRRAATMRTTVARWRPCFNLLLTEEGRLGCDQVINERRAWTSQTFPSRVDDVVSSLQQLAESRGDLLTKSNALWEDSLDLWITGNRPGNRLPTSEVCSAVAKYQDLLRELSEQTATQMTLVDDLKSIMKVANVNHSTLSTPSAQGGPISVGDVRESFELYEVIWIECARLTETSNRLNETLRGHMTTLEGARARE